MFILFVFEETMVLSIRVNLDSSILEVLWPALMSNMDLLLKVDLRCLSSNPLSEGGLRRCPTESTPWR